MSRGDFPHRLEVVSGQTRFRRETSEAMGDLMVSPGVWSDPSFAVSKKGSKHDRREPSLSAGISEPVGECHVAMTVLHVARRCAATVLLYKLSGN